MWESGGVGEGCSVVLYLKNVTRSEGLCIEEEEKSRGWRVLGGLSVIADRKVH